MLQLRCIIVLALHGFGCISQLIRIVAEIGVLRDKPSQISLPLGILATPLDNYSQPQIEQRLVLFGLRLMLCLDLCPPLFQSFDFCPCYPRFNMHFEQGITIQLHAGGAGLDTRA